MWPPKPKIFTTSICPLALETKYMATPHAEYMENGQKNDKNRNKKII